jgi:hypothetical protein
LVFIIVIFEARDVVVVWSVNGCVIVFRWLCAIREVRGWTSRQNFDVPAKNYNTKKSQRRAKEQGQTMANVSVRAPC